MREDLTRFAFHRGAVLALGTMRAIGLLVGRGRQRIGGETGGDALSDGVGGAFDLAEGQAARRGHRMEILASKRGEYFLGDAVEFRGRWFCEGHGQAG